ncbi:hypothetical protein ACOQFO_02890 [Ureibacillus sp. MALMAid1270]|uniref:hypothetical protein n=1 Tax=Ureibacillus sp. MALMAid1270 TaxID=3411629 RepID=UPI003BA71E1E
MQLHEIIIFGLVWGSLMIYFLTPFNQNVSADTKDQTIITFSQAFKKSLIKVVLHKKAILTGILLISTITYFGFYFYSTTTYIKAHGESEFTKLPKVDDIYYLVGVCIYAVILYFCAALNWSGKYMKNSSK